MSRADREKWDAKHAAAAVGSPPERLIRWQSRLPARGRALDLACGAGAVALWLARERGFTVDAIDCSAVALRGLARRRDELAVPRVHPIVADLDDPPFRPRCGRYAVICAVSFLDRRMRDWIPELLAEHGVLFLETFHLGHRADAPNFRAEWLLDRGELRTMFPVLELVEYEEDATRAALLARRPS